MRRRACPTPTRSKATSKTCRGSTSPIAPASSCIRRRGTSASSGCRYFNQQKDGVETELVAVGLDGAPVPGIPIDVTLTQVQWISVRRAEGNGFYTWETRAQGCASRRVARDERRGAGAARRFRSRPAASSSSRRARTPIGIASTVTRTPFYALGEGYTAWERYDHNRIDLVPEKNTYKPGETARIMIQSPWEQATALVTTEREGIRTHRQFTLTSTQQSIDVPLTEEDIPNVFVSVLLVKGRSKPRRRVCRSDDDPSDPGKPSFRLGYVQLDVEDATKRLTVARHGEQGRVPPGKRRQGDRRRQGSSGSRHRRAK